MRKTMKLLIVLVTILLPLVCKAKISSAANSKSHVQFANNFCKSISQDPIITVCVSGDPGEYELNEHSLRVLKNKTRKLVRDYKKSNRSFNPKFSTTSCGSQCTQTDWDAQICGGASFCGVYPNDPSCTSSNPCLNGPSPTCSMFCTTHPADPTCRMLYPPSACTLNDWNPTTCGGTSYCAMYPTDPACTQNPCLNGPSPTCSMFCTTHPADPTCLMLYPPSACTLNDWNPTTCGGTSFCAVHPTDPACAPLHPCANGPSPTCSMFCTTHPADPTCVVVTTPTTCTYGDWIPSVCDTSGLNRDYCEVHPTDLVNCPF